MTGLPDCNPFLARMREAWVWDLWLLPVHPNMESLLERGHEGAYPSLGQRGHFSANLDSNLVLGDELAQLGRALDN